jgi:transcriptional regulator of arginine metabolism
MNKSERLKIIEEIITSENISSQEQLLHHMEGRGISCTQATLSRDLRRIGVSRFSESGGTPYYRVVRGGQITQESSTDIFFKAIESVLWAKDLVIIKTSPGFAAGVASSIDKGLKRPLAGTVAGDDTIIVIPRDGFARVEVMKSLDEVFPGIEKFLKR